MAAVPWSAGAVDSLGCGVAAESSGVRASDASSAVGAAADSGSTSCPGPVCAPCSEIVIASATPTSPAHISPIFKRRVFAARIPAVLVSCSVSILCPLFLFN